MSRVKFWMVVSGFFAFSFFLIANITSIFLELNVIAGCIQVVLNIFVFSTWLRGYRISTGFKKFVIGIGVVMPIIMMSITIIRVLIPAILSI